MAQVTVTIDDKAYRMACEEGQEEHLTGLATRFDRYVGHLKGQFGEIGDLRLTVMASIMIMDELTENERRMKALENEVESLRRTRDSAAARSEKTDDQLAGSLAEITERVERISAKLHGAPRA
jgi:cell division protein ZapA